MFPKDEGISQQINDFKKRTLGKNMGKSIDTILQQMRTEQFNNYFYKLMIIKKIKNIYTKGINMSESRFKVYEIIMILVYKNFLIFKISTG